MGLCSAYERERVGRRMFRPVIPWDHHTAHLVDRHGLLGHGLRSLLASPGYTHAFAIAGWHVLGGQDVAHDLLYSRFVVRSALAGSILSDAKSLVSLVLSTHKTCHTNIC